RGVGFVFQHYAAFKHMTVWSNVAFGLTIRRLPRADIKQRVGELLELVQLSGLAKRYPAQLSGGQRQRMGLARALAVDPKVLLLDEPFGALDARVRKELRLWLRRLHDETHTTTVIVTHDQEEAMEVADRVVVMNAGQIEQTAPPRAPDGFRGLELRQCGCQASGSADSSSIAAGSSPLARSPTVTCSSTARRLARTAIQTSRRRSAEPAYSTVSGPIPRTFAIGPS